MTQRTEDPRTALWTATSAEVVAEACEELFGPDIDRLTDALPGAIAGREADLRRYLDAWRACAEKLVGAIETSAEERSRGTTAGEREAHDPASILREPIARAPSRGGRGEGRSRSAEALGPEYLDHGAVEAPVSPRVSDHGERAGLILALVERVRSLFGAPALEAPSGGVAFDRWSLDREAWSRFRSLAESELRSAHDSRAVLARIRDLFALNLTELGELFGISRQAATVWLRDGVPPARRAKAGAVLDLAELLSRKLRPGRVAGVVRRPSAEHGGRSFLELIAEDRHEELLERVRDSFDWAATA